MPSCSIGFCVASTRNGSGSGYVVSPIVTWRSCIASSSALCTLAGARLISSARTRLAKIGPLRGVNSAVARIVDQRADDVGGQQVRRELDAIESRIQTARQRDDRERLGQAGHAFDQDVIAGDQRGQQPFQQRALSNDHGAELLANRGHPRQVFRHRIYCTSRQKG